MKKLSETYKELGIEFTFPIEIRNSNGKETYYEGSKGLWYRYEYDTKGNPTYYENSNNRWKRWEYDTNGNLTYYEDSEGLTEGTPRSQPSETLATNDEIAELKAQLSELRQMLTELHEVNAELHKEIAELER